MSGKCRCGDTATHAYGSLSVCAGCYQTHAAIDDSPNRIPRDYDWSTEMDARQLND
ncbi:hypothetical protein [Kutzneria sp. CA-103260]|uniref:hypothetical protein n=1 Tax=Kutzneria sp. CA-103260 TaxID=2802641 RepID=UPI001BA76A1C|nr:hypothetical protein [Kutzneria sp. CA-103260]QUQ70582.1 hypothetical protein JJ691_83620 [Kutzneria sp. CA-103260]